MTAVGTVAWAKSREPRGSLTWGDKWALRIQGLPVGFMDLSSKLARRFGVASPAKRFHGSIIDEVEKRLPERSGGIFAEAHAMCEDVSNSIARRQHSGSRPEQPWLLDHCYRTFAFGVLWALQRGLSDVSWGRLYVASMLHDIELSGVGADARVPCFAVRGGRKALELALRCGWSESEARELEEAICLHLNPRVGRSNTAVAQLLAAGTALDVAGVGFFRLPEEAVLAIADWERAPRRDGLREQMWRSWTAESDLAPRCRGQFLNRPLPWLGECLGLRRRIFSTSTFSDRPCSSQRYPDT